MFSDVSLEERVPARHPLRELRGLVDALLASMSAEFEAVYARRGRPSVPPEMLLKALLLQILFSIRSMPPRRPSQPGKTACAGFGPTQTGTWPLRWGFFNGLLGNLCTTPPTRSWRRVQGQYRFVGWDRNRC